MNDMKIYVLINTSYGMDNEIVGVFSSEKLADQFALSYCTSESGELDSDAYLLIENKEYEVDSRFYKAFKPKED